MWKAYLKPVFYYGASYSGLNWMLRHIHGKTGLLVLCYHGVVSDDHEDDPFLYRNTVSRRQFRRQLEILNRNFHPISLSDLIASMETGTALRPNSVLVGFDDGYRNNLTNAAPLLREYGTPAVINVSTGYVNRSDLLWPDEVNLRVLHWRRHWIPFPSKPGGWTEIEMPRSREGRISAADSVRAKCKALARDERLRYLEALRAEDCPELDRRDRELYDFLSWDEVRSLANAGFDIGSHTVHHPILTQIGPELLDFELTQSKAQIEAETLKTCDCLVYPNGQTADFDERVMNAAERTGYKMAFTATGTYTRYRGNRYALSRIGMSGQTLDQIFESRISGLDTLVRRVI